jgi:hypothetical protein
MIMFLHPAQCPLKSILGNVGAADIPPKITPFGVWETPHFEESFLIRINLGICYKIDHPIQGTVLMEGVPSED